MPCMTCSDSQHGDHKYYIGLVLYMVLLLVFFTGHKSLLMYAHLKVLEALDQVVLMEGTATSVILVDGVPSYFSIVITVILLLGLTIVVCASDYTTQKNFITIIAGFTLVLSCMCTIAQISVVVYKDIMLFLDIKAPDVAECFCLDDNTTADQGIVHHWTPGSQQQQLEKAVQLINESTLGMSKSITNKSSNAVDIWAGLDDLVTAIESSLSSGFDNCTLYWCRCNVPGEEFPVGFSVTDVHDTVITPAFLRQFLEKDEYDGDNVTTYMVDTKDELLENTDNDFYYMKMMLGMAELSVLYVVLRLPMFVIAKKAKVAEAENKTTVQGTGLQSYIFKAIHHVQVKEGTSDTFKAFLGIVVFAFVESLDSYTLLDDIIEHRYTFSSDRTLTYVTLSLVLLNSIVVNGSSIIVFLGDKPPAGEDSTDGGKVHKAMEITKLVVVILSNVPFMALRSYLLYVYNGFDGAQIGSVYVIFIIKEVVLFTLGVIEFAMTADAVKKKQETAKMDKVRKSFTFLAGGSPKKPRFTVRTAADIWMRKAGLRTNRTIGDGHSLDIDSTNRTGTLETEFSSEWMKYGISDISMNGGYGYNNYGVSNHGDDPAMETNTPELYKIPRVRYWR